MHQINVACPACHRPYCLPVSLVGRKARCAACQARFRVGGTPPAAPVMAPPSNAPWVIATAASFATAAVALLVAWLAIHPRTPPAPAATPPVFVKVEPAPVAVAPRDKPAQSSETQPAVTAATVAAPPPPQQPAAPPAPQLLLLQQLQQPPAERRAEPLVVPFPVIVPDPFVGPVQAGPVFMQSAPSGPVVVNQGTPGSRNNIAVAGPPAAPAAPSATSNNSQNQTITQTKVSRNTIVDIRPKQAPTKSPTHTRPWPVHHR